MNDQNTRALDAENELAEAIEKIKSSVADIEKLKKASETLEDVGSRIADLANQLLEAATKMHEGSKYLSEVGVKEFDAKLNEFGIQLDRGLGELAERLKGVDSTLDGLPSVIQKELDASIGTKMEKLHEKFDKGNGSLRLMVIAFGILILGLVTYIGFFK